MQIRAALPDDAEQIASIYAPIVRDTAISFELVPPSAEEMRGRIAAVTVALPWLVGVDAATGSVVGYAYAGRHRDRAAYRWSVDSTIYVDASHRGRGVARLLYTALFTDLAALGYFQVFAGIALPNAASVGLHEALGFSPIGVYRAVGYKCGNWRDVGWWQKALRTADGAQPPEPLLFRGGAAVAVPEP